MTSVSGCCTWSARYRRPGGQLRPGGAVGRIAARGPAGGGGPLRTARRRRRRPLAARRQRPRRHLDLQGRAPASCRSPCCAPRGSRSATAGVDLARWGWAPPPDLAWPCPRRPTPPEAQPKAIVGPRWTTTTRCSKRAPEEAGAHRRAHVEAAVLAQVAGVVPEAGDDPAERLHHARHQLGAQVFVDRRRERRVEGDAVAVLAAPGENARRARGPPGRRRAAASRPGLAPTPLTST
jgi:hypothetical protein